MITETTTSKPKKTKWKIECNKRVNEYLKRKLKQKQGLKRMARNGWSENR